MEHPEFLGAHDVSIDSKNRLLIPRALRNAIKDAHGKDFIVKIGSNKRPWMYPDQYYMFMLREQAKQPGAVESVARDRKNYGSATPVEQDDQGRVLIPAKSFNWKYLDKSKPLVLVGIRDHIEYWQRDEWDAYQERLIELDEEEEELPRRRSESTPVVPSIPASTSAPATGSDDAGDVS